ncbi:hypothetical protein AX16_001451 [Volvariella volvacea WC 439]|nr:hypothetical protein AX16_001451 [Volvariella volvacea WC 439]
MAFRDANVIIVETSRTTVRAGLGLHELLKTPTVEFPARVGLRRNASNPDRVNGASPTNLINGKAALSSHTTSLPQFSDSKAATHDYLVGAQLDEALTAGQDIIVSWPFAAGDVYDFTQAEALWKYALFKQLERRRAQMESPVLLSIIAGLSRSAHERISQIFFERFNVAGFAVLERPIGQMYASNTLSGVVVDIDWEKTDVTPIYDGFIVPHARTSTPLGIRDCQSHLANILLNNQSVKAALVPPDSTMSQEELHAASLDLVKQLLEDGHIKIPSDGETAIPEDEGVTDIAAVLVAGKEKAVIESGMKKKATAKASAAEQARAREIEALDLITVQFRDHTITLGKERHRLCEPLFDPTVLTGVHGDHTDPGGALPVQDTVAHSINQTDIDQRQYIWAGLFVTGDLTKKVKGIGIALQSRLSPYLSNPDLQTDLQARSIRVLNLPEYYPEYRDTGESYAAFLGASITAKIIFNDTGGRNYVSKSDYSSKGPSAIIEMAPSLL